ncbi:unnamed protein product [Rotaria socialis]|uniref:Uncharacterized protein n=1 Tax=Rotaria socialis TaxID=392032 RepID=A0A817MP17_9BILA|nr:unnamed protein product [Rotaria socialis]CAF3320768.1 unnamed protein product [Rotaria socialis]CAF3618452.1 unnamed protein product [Rotaria socialis]CAF3643619.1 unnamed protein product [Rotaria socialis]CAF4189922.1 unnamed protein product [Rotaria socialis]
MNTSLRVRNSISACSAQIDHHHHHHHHHVSQNQRTRFNRIATDSRYRQSCYYTEMDAPKNNLDFRLRTCYNHAEESFASKARFVVQPVTVCNTQKKEKSNSSQNSQYPLEIINKNRKEHFNEATKGQHIGSHHFANSKHGYSRVIAGAMSTD